MYKKPIKVGPKKKRKRILNEDRCLRGVNFNEKKLSEIKEKMMKEKTGFGDKAFICMLKQLEIQIRSNSSFDEETWGMLADLPDWEYRIVQDFILRVNMAKEANDLNFVYKLYENAEKLLPSKINKKYDLVIACLKRDQKDICLTDVWNRLIVPNGLKHKIIEIWGFQVTKARNFAVEQALKMGAKYLLFIDDDIIAPNNALMKLYNLMKERECPVTSGLYYKKVEPLEAPFENDNGQIYIPTEKDKNPITVNIQEVNRICGMGFALLNLETITQDVALPLFWEFGAPDGYWSMGEDAFFTMNLFERSGKGCLVDTSIKCLHMDKTWKKIYGERDNEVVYATGIWDHTDIKHFERMRVPPEYPLILVCIPTRDDKEPVACNLDELMLLRGYRTELFRPYGMRVDEVRNVCAQEALQREAQYLLFIDNDVLPPQTGLVKLLEHMEKINEPCVVSGNYYMKGDPDDSASLQLDPDNKRHPGIVTDLNRTKVFKEGKLFKSNWLIGLGFALIDTAIFKQARQPWFQCYAKGKHTDVNEDAHFSELCFQNGYNIYIDPNVECMHLDFNNGIAYGKYNQDIKYAEFPNMLSQFRLFKREPISHEIVSEVKEID